MLASIRPWSNEVPSTRLYSISGALAALVGLWLADIGASGPDSPWHAISPLGRFQNFNAGLLDSSDALFFVLFTGVFLLLTIRRLHNNRTYG